jgi:hypothetical protein
MAIEGLAVDALAGDVDARVAGIGAEKLAAGGKTVGLLGDAKFPQGGADGGMGASRMLGAAVGRPHRGGGLVLSRLLLRWLVLNRRGLQRLDPAPVGRFRPGGGGLGPGLGLPGRCFMRRGWGASTVGGMLGMVIAVGRAATGLSAGMVVAVIAAAGSRMGGDRAG